jgi:fructose-1-phosphate kinase PfkB-like protein
VEVGLETPAAVRAAAEPLLDGGVQRIVVSMGGEGAVFVDRESWSSPWRFM